MRVHQSPINHNQQLSMSSQNPNQNNQNSNMNQGKSFVQAEVNTKSLVGRQAVLNMLLEQDPSAPNGLKGAFGGNAQELLRENENKKHREQNPFNFNSNIYNKFSPRHAQEHVEHLQQNKLVDLVKINVVKRLKKEGKIESTGRSDVPLKLYQGPAEEHLYTNTVTQRVPVAHDQAFQSQAQNNSNGLPMTTNQQEQLQRLPIGRNQNVSKGLAAGHHFKTSSFRSPLPNRPNQTQNQNQQMIGQSQEMSSPQQNTYLGTNSGGYIRQSPQVVARKELAMGVHDTYSIRQQKMVQYLQHQRKYQRVGGDGGINVFGGGLSARNSQNQSTARASNYDTLAARSAFDESSSMINQNRNVVQQSIFESHHNHNYYHNNYPSYNPSPMQQIDYHEALMTRSGGPRSNAGILVSESIPGTTQRFIDEEVHSDSLFQQVSTKYKQEVLLNSSRNLDIQLGKKSNKPLVDIENAHFLIQPDQQNSGFNSQSDDIFDREGELSNNFGLGQLQTQKRPPFLKRDWTSRKERRTNYNEIREMCKKVNPQAYLQSYQIQMQAASEDHNAEQRKLGEKKDSVALAVQQSDWHAPVKRNKIFNDVLAMAADEKPDEAIDLAVVANQIARYGVESETKQVVSSMNQGIKSLMANMKQSAASRSKLRLTQKTGETNQMGGMGKSEKDADNDDPNVTIHAGGFSLLQTISNNSKGGPKFPQAQKNEEEKAATLEVDKSSKLEITVQSLEETTKMEANLQKKMTISPVPQKIGGKDSLGVGDGGKRKAGSLMYNIRQNVRNDFTSKILGRKKSTSSIQSFNRKGSAQNSRSRISQREPYEESSNQGMSGRNVDQQKIQSRILEKRRQKQKSLQNTRNSQNLITSQVDRQSFVSGVTAGNITGRFNAAARQTGLYNTTSAVNSSEVVAVLWDQTQPNTAANTTNQNQNEEIYAQMQTIKSMQAYEKMVDKRIQKHKNVKVQLLSNNKILSPKKDQHEAESKQIARGQQFISASPQQTLDLQTAYKGNSLLVQTTTIQTTANQQVQQSTSKDSSIGGNNNQALIAKKLAKMTALKQFELEQEMEAERFALTRNREEIAKQTQLRRSSTMYKNQQKEEKVAQIDVQKLLNLNNAFIQQILKSSAQVVQKADYEARQLMRKVITARDLKTYDLQAFIGKSVMLNIGNLYKPLTFTFKDWRKDFTVYFSAKEARPGTSFHGYEFKIENQTTVEYPQDLHIFPGTQRFGKDKILYLTFESTENSHVTVSMTHNKKVEEEIEVKAVKEDDTLLTLKKQLTKNATQMSSQESLKSPKAKPTEVPLQVISTVKKMLGSDQVIKNADKANKMLAKKIQFMVNDPEVADEFLGLVDQVKNAKVERLREAKKDFTERNKLREEMLVEQNRPKHFDGLEYTMTSFNGAQVQDDGQYPNNPNQNPMYISQGVQNANETQQNSTTYDQILGIEAAYHQRMHFDANESPKGSPESPHRHHIEIDGRRLAKAQKHQRKIDEAQKRKQEILDAQRQQAIDNLKKQEHRQVVQKEIMDFLQKRDTENRLIRQWKIFALSYKAMKNLLAQFVKQKQEREFLMKTALISQKMVIRMTRKLKRYGPNFEERERRKYRHSIMCTSSMVHVTSEKSRDVVYKFLEALRLRKEIVKKTLRTSSLLHKLQSRFQSYFQVRNQQVKFLTDIMQREVQRIQASVIRDNDPTLKQIAWNLNRLKDSSIYKIAFNYHKACSYRYEPEFFAWRNKIKQFLDQGLDDMNEGWSFPFLKSRTVATTEEIFYKVVVPKNSLHKYFQAIHKATLSKNRYFLGEIRTGSAMGSSQHDVTSQRASSAGAMSENPSEDEKRRMQSKLRRKNVHYATLLDAIKNEESKFSAKKTDMEGCVYFPSKPALRFIPCPFVLHQLIFQAIMFQFPKLEAPEQWVKDFDFQVDSGNMINNQGASGSLKGRRDTQRSDHVSLESPQQRGSAMNRSGMSGVEQQSKPAMQQQSSSLVFVPSTVEQFRKQFEHPVRMNADNAFDIHYDGEEVQQENVTNGDTRRNSMTDLPTSSVVQQQQIQQQAQVVSEFDHLKRPNSQGSTTNNQQKSAHDVVNEVDALEGANQLTADDLIQANINEGKVEENGSETAINVFKIEEDPSGEQDEHQTDQDPKKQQTQDQQQQRE